MPLLLAGLARSLPEVPLVLIVSNYSLIDPQLFRHHPKLIIHKVPASRAYDSACRAKNRFYPNGIRYIHYVHFIEHHPEFHQVMVCDDDTLVLRDPFELLHRDPTRVHMMRDIYPMSVREDGNYIWFHAWEMLDPQTKQKFGLKTKLAVSESEFDATIPVNSGFVLAVRSEFLKMARIMTVFRHLYSYGSALAEQGLINWLIFSGQFKDQSVNLHTYGIMDEIVSCPWLMSKKQLHRHKTIFVIHKPWAARNGWLPREVLVLREFFPNRC